MDSFYDEPRRPPIPANINQIPSCQLMPDVSILVPNGNKHDAITQNNVTINRQNSYNVWKAQNLHPQPLRCNKENISTNNQPNYCQKSISKIAFTKQVRFNSSNIQSAESQDLSNSNMHDNVSKCIKSNNLRTNILNRPFEEIYMANIPNRHLDLSIIEPVTYQYNKIATNPVKEVCNMTRTYQPTNTTNTDCKSNMGNNDSIMDNSNYHKPTTPRKLQEKLHQLNKCVDISKTDFHQIRQYNDSYFSYSAKPHKYVQSNEYPNNSIENKQCDDEPTVKDLLKVVQQQNEQIILLQKQVALLLENQSNQKQIEAPPIKKKPNHSEEHISNTEIQQNEKGTVSKFAIDVMTSFEVSIRQPSNFQRNRTIKDFNSEPKIQEIMETDTNIVEQQNMICDNILGDIKADVEKSNKNKNQNTQVSFALGEPIEIMEECLSPENSIHVDMQDYSSDSDDDSAESTDIGWTIYNNVMGQVNNILKNANDMKNFGGESNKNTNRICDDRTLRKVKEATMRHLKNIGVNLPITGELNSSHRSDETVNGSKYTPTEISFAVKQLLMKYLPDDQLAKINAKPPIIQKPDGNTENLIKRRPEFSFATLQYMKKYNLLTSESIQMESIQQNKHKEMPKILDVTALKQQPKLL